MDLQPTVITWILVGFGIITVMGLLYAQFLLLREPQGQKARNLIIGKGEDWRDRSHFRFSYGLAWADWMVWMPLMVSGTIGVSLGQVWGYVVWGAAGIISLYTGVVLWFAEREYVYPSCGPLAYYTYIWGNFVYWGILAIVYAGLRLSGVLF
ncbi:MAG: hypothetical protein HN929_12010 [Chloroflexi bacterium]|jgi:hypothetical protein|nr:hypothetical protein [Chloroflexota bacterium]MBT7082164.1 hypothetical protein [Chloroflexota bacterium]MBT7290048.1 hypothetical protein [Chloroflexota bacterium]